MSIALNKNNFDGEVKSFNGRVIVDFWAVWCGPCKMIAPELESLEQDPSISVKIGKVNVDEEPDICVEYGIEVIPTLILFRDGKEEKRITGYFSKDEIIEKLGL